jgi:hypothetical protein
MAARTGLTSGPARAGEARVSEQSGTCSPDVLDFVGRRWEEERSFPPSRSRSWPCSARFLRAQFFITGTGGPGWSAHRPNEFLHLPMAKRLTA